MISNTHNIAANCDSTESARVRVCSFVTIKSISSVFNCYYTTQRSSIIIIQQTKDAFYDNERTDIYTQTIPNLMQ